MQAFGDRNGNHIPDAFENMNIFADNDKDGVPDILESVTTGNAIVNSIKIIVDGKEFNGIENLPPEARARYEQAMSKLDANRNGIPDFVEGMINATNQTANVSTSLETEAPPRSTTFDYNPPVMTPLDRSMPANPTSEIDKSNGWQLVLAGLFVVLLCVAGAAGVWYFFLR
jgi:hypothetical protein